MRKNYKYFLAIIAQFSKFGKVYILSDKKAIGVFRHSLSFGKSNRIHRDNGKEFCNLFNKYCIYFRITHICCRSYHLKSLGCVESFNKGIKRLLEAKYL